jgi:hypothetical protein
MTFEERVKSMSAKEIIMAMVEGLRDPKIEVDMGTLVGIWVVYATDVPQQIPFAT